MIRKNLSLALLVTVLSGAGAVVGSILGSGFMLGLFPVALAGGLLGVLVGADLAVRLRLVARERILPTALAAAAGFVLASAVAILNLHTPWIPIAASTLTGLGAVTGNRYLSWTLLPRSDLALALSGLAFATPALYFVSASLLKFHLGVNQPYSPLESLLADPDRFHAFNLLSPIIFLGGLALAVLLNLYPQLRVQLRRGDEGWVATLTARANLLNLTVVALGCALAAALVGYVVLENLPRL
jgi:hypothetical protein